MRFIIYMDVGYVRLCASHSDSTETYNLHVERLKLHLCVLL